MKDSEFKELLNLYLDHEITAADAARLEAEVQSNPARRALYQDYCRMQKACKMLAEDFASEPTPAADRKVVAFPSAPRTPRRSVAVFGSLAAAAACVALIFVARNGQEPAPATGNAMAAASSVTVPAPTLVASTEPAAVAAAVAQTAPATGGIHRHPANNLSLRQAAADALVLANAANTDPNFTWMQNLQLKPVELPSNELKLNVESAIAPTDRTYLGPRRPNGEALPIGFRFQK